MACVRREVGEDEIDDEKIYWVFTVPQSWTGRSKQFMREAAYEVTHIIARQDSYANISICRLATLCVLWEHSFALLCYLYFCWEVLKSGTPCAAQAFDNENLHSSLP